MKRIRDLKSVERPRELMIKKGSGYLSDRDLIAVIIGSGSKGYDVRKIASRLVSKYGAELIEINYRQIAGIPGIGVNKALSIVAARELFLRLSREEESNKSLKIDTVQKAAQMFLHIANKKKEHLVCLYLDSRKILIKRKTISIGTLNSGLFHPREIFEPAIKCHAACVIIGHNHPSGVADSSKEDEEITKQIVKAGEILGIPVLDHIIITKNSWKGINC